MQMYTDPNVPNVYYARPKGPLKPHHVAVKTPRPEDAGDEHKYQYNVNTEQWHEVPLTPDEQYKAGVKKAAATYHRDAWNLGRVGIWLVEYLWPTMSQEDRDRFHEIVPPAVHRRIIKSLNAVPGSGALSETPANDPIGDSNATK